jgi:hypothetical protein
VDARQFVLSFHLPYVDLNLKTEPNTGDETNEMWNWDVAEVLIGSDFKNIRFGGMIPASHTPQNGIALLEANCVEIRLFLCHFFYG